MAMVEEQHSVAAGDIHILFADGRLLQLLAGNTDPPWQDAIRGYLRYSEGKIVHLTYGLRFHADFFQGVR